MLGRMSPEVRDQTDPHRAGGEPRPADRRLEELGFEPHYKVSTPAKWMVTANDTLQVVNFFESINTSYEVNAKARS